MRLDGEYSLSTTNPLPTLGKLAMNDPLRPEDAKEKAAEDEVRDESLLDTCPVG